ncbi:glucose-6-phosphate isomerase family protein [uncultured Thermanaerothrix sp.]|uniref:glucose-6-phosphate isomerase family protein n=1 Tax=uncultured Thermanaerothrix sp. TaxID=1195149 RepID=UPI00262C044C|nr:glucose-6-phosphate isomerase family protein [uncultured Thermanaerothrix sp.]
MLSSTDYPVSLNFDTENGTFDPCPQVTPRHLSDLKKMFRDQHLVEKILRDDDPLIYEIRYYPFTTTKSDMALAVTRIFPGTIGDEYYMTKGHKHQRDDQAEVYYCVKGEGFLLLDTLEGDFQAIPWQAGIITHIPPMWAHRVVNTGNDLLVFIGIFHLSAGHDYDIVACKGFSYRVLSRNGRPQLVKQG